MCNIDVNWIGSSPGEKAGAGGRTVGDSVGRWRSILMRRSTAITMARSIRTAMSIAIADDDGDASLAPGL
jgi:hypothetical protein